jgi:hypothetical protein
MGLFDFFKREKKPRYIYSEGDLLVFFVECEKCKELFRVIVRKHSELYRTYGKGTGEYEIQKEIIGSKCQNRINIHFDLKPSYAELDHDISGGRLLTREEYNELMNKNNS